MRSRLRRMHMRRRGRRSITSEAQSLSARLTKPASACSRGAVKVALNAPSTIMVWNCVTSRAWCAQVVKSVMQAGVASDGDAGVAQAIDELDLGALGRALWRQQGPDRRR